MFNFFEESLFEVMSAIASCFVKPEDNIEHFLLTSMEIALETPYFFFKGMGFIVMVGSNIASLSKLLLNNQTKIKIYEYVGSFCHVFFWYIKCSPYYTPFYMCYTNTYLRALKNIKKRHCTNQGQISKYHNSF